MSKREGFSIIELALVMAIIAVVAGIAIPRYGRAIASYRASAAGQRIASDIALAQATARGTSSSVAITFIPAAAGGAGEDRGGGYTIDGIRDLERASNTYTVRLAIEPYLASIASVTSTNAGPMTPPTSPVTLTFDGYGTGDGNVTVVVQSAGAQRTVTFNAATGRCAIQ
jgi:prepilin-type N-terminal cleavage/methylation domain-containing protein